jgi:hypothetical protein
MIDGAVQYCATDKELFDLLMSGKQRLTESVLFGLARDRGIFYSPKSSREEIVQRMALLTHDIHDLDSIVQLREHSGREERTASIVLDAEITSEEIRSALSEYSSTIKNTEKVTIQPRTSLSSVINLEYDEYDYSRTRLIQRQTKQATIDIVVKDGKTIIRMPANEKARGFVDELSGRVEKERKEKIERKVISLADINSADKRTTFFTKLISRIAGYKLQNVTNIRVARWMESDSGSIDLEETELDVRDEMLAVVKSVVMHGQNLVASEQYQKLREDGFFITSITWRSVQLQAPNDLVQFDAGFDDGLTGTGFKYGVRYAHRLSNGEYAKNLKAVPESRKPSLFALIEKTAASVVESLENPEEGGDSSGEGE